MKYIIKFSLWHYYILFNENVILMENISHNVLYTHADYFSWDCIGGRIRQRCSVEKNLVRRMERYVM